MDALTQMRLEFNRHLLEAIGGQILDTSVFSWQAGFTSYLLGFCMAIAFFQSVLKSEKSMLVEWSKIIIASWFCLAILGGVQATNVPIFSSMNSSLPDNYKVKSKRAPTLERIVFNWMAWKFDLLGEAIMQSNNGGKENLNDEIIKLNTYQEKLLNAIAECDTSNTACLKQYLTGDPQAIKENAEKTDPANKGESGGFFSGAVPGLGVITSLMAKIAAFFAKINNPAYWLFPILMFILDIARAFINFFVLLTFGIIAAMSLFMTKILCVFMVIPSYRDRVIGMFKFTLSASMYGFAMNLMLWISIIITKALNEATGTIIIQRLTSMNGVGAGASFAGEMGVLMMSNFLTSFVIMLMQIVAMTKVPSFTEKLMNLSLQELVNIGETLFKAGLGMAKVAAGMAAGVGGLALGAAGGALAGAASNSSAVSGLGSSMSGKFRGMMGWNTDGPGDFGGSGGGAPPQGGGGGGSMFTPNPAAGRGGGSDLTNVAMGEANLKASTSRNADSILKAEKAEEDMTGPEKLEFEKKKADALDKAEQQAAGDRVAKLARGGGGGSGSTRALTVSEQRAKREADMKSGFSRLKSVGGAVGGTLMSMAYDGAMGGVGSGDGLNTFKGTMGKFGDNAGNMAEAAYEGGSKAAAWAGSSFKKPDLEDRAANAEEVYRSAVVGGKTDVSGADSSMLTQNLSAINSGSASNEQMRQVLEAQNTKNLSKEQKDSIGRARNTSQSFGTMMADQETSNKAFMQNLASEFSNNGGQLSNKTMQELSSKTSAGLLDYNDVSKQAVDDGSGGAGTTLGSALGNITQQDLRAALAPMTQKLDAGQQLSVAEQQQSRRMFDTNKDALVGQTDLLDGFDKTLGGTANTEGMRKSREDSTSVVEGIMQSIKDAGKNLNAEIMPGMEMSLATKNQQGRTTKTGGIDGFYMGGQAVTNNNDFKQLSPSDQQRFNEMHDYLKLAVEDKEANNMMKERMANLRLNSENVLQILEQMKKIKNG